MSKDEILIIEDEKAARLALQKALTRDDRTVRVASTGEEGLQLFDEHPVPVVLTDIKLPGIDGMEVLRRLRERDTSVKVIVMTAFGTVALAVEALTLHKAHDFIEKPLDLAGVRRVVELALADHRRMARGMTAVKRAGDGFAGMIGGSPQMRRIYETIEQVAPSRATVLITGENGTGKNLVARAIHALSRRRGELMEVNLAALAPTLIESELFGVAEGAYTDAKPRKGRFEEADGSTIFLDEIGEIPTEIQVKLLHVLQDRAFERVGSSARVKVDLRLITATNRDLAGDVASGKFREDLYYRIKVIPIHVPPLRERRADIPLLVNHFVRLHATENARHVVGVSDEALAALQAYDWPGNIRELGSVIEQAVVFSKDEVLPAALFPLAARTQPLAATDDRTLQVPMGTALKDVEKEMILLTLDYVDGNKTQAAKILGISPRTLYRKLDEYGE